MKYNFDEINIGDEVYFESTSQQNSHDLYWKVLVKYPQQKELIVGLDTMGFKDERWTIGILEVLYHLPLSQKDRKL